MIFDQMFDRLIGNEGGYSNDPKDPGGETNHGVTWPTLRAAIAAKIVPASTTIKTLKREQSKAIYFELFWKRCNADKMIDGVAFQVFDFAVNSSIETAVRKLQVALGVADDGQWGPVSQKACDSASESDVIFRYLAERLDFMRKLKNWPDHGKGWAGRIAQNMRFAAVDS